MLAISTRRKTESLDNRHPSSTLSTAHAIGVPIARHADNNQLLSSRPRDNHDPATALATAVPSRDDLWETGMFPTAIGRFDWTASVLFVWLTRFKCFVRLETFRLKGGMDLTPK